MAELLCHHRQYLACGRPCCPVWVLLRLRPPSDRALPQPPGITSVLPPPLLPPVAPEPEEETGAFHDPILDRDSACTGSEPPPAPVCPARRMKSQLGSGAFRGAGGGLAGLDANLVPLGVREVVPQREATPVPEAEPVPAVEWWDRGLLAHGSLDQDITIYVEHPVPLDPPAEAPPPPPQPLKLTARELKKLRTQRRLARDKEKQELIRQGLLEPPKPKVRIANLHRVLGTDASLDPTAVEKEVRKQMAERQAAHEDRNLARKLTPAERRDKKLRKLFGVAAVEAGVTEVAGAGKKGGAAAAAAASGAAAAAAGVDLVCSVYRVGRLTDPQHRFKVDANARENHMTGMTIVSDDFSLVVVEGVDKATRRYLKLMMRRIDCRDANGDAAMEDEDEDAPPNVCTLVWQGTVLRRAFVGFRTETVRSAAAGRQLLEELGVGHYWDAAAGATEGESVPYTL
eukprot:XP_001696748.1 predicted protein [Chlamydomonas reinhardtii]